MTINPKPSLRSVREQIEARIAGGSLEPIEAWLDELDRARAAADRIDASKLIDEEKRKQRDGLRRGLRLDEQIDAAVRAHPKWQARAHEENAIHAGLANGKDDAAAVARELRAANVAQMIQSTSLAKRHQADTFGGAVVALFDDALALGDEVVIRAAGPAAVRRLEDAASREAAGSPARVEASKLRDRFERWRRDHPSARERLAQLAQEKDNIRTLVGASARFAMQLYGFGAASPPPPMRRPVPDLDPRGRLRVGPAWDALAGGDPHARR